MADLGSAVEVYRPQHAVIDGALPENLGQVVLIYAADGHRGERTRAHDPAHSLESQCRIGFVLGRGREDRADADVVRRDFPGAEFLILVVGGQAEDLPRLRPELARLGEAQVVLSQVNAVGVHFGRNLHVVVDDEERAAPGGDAPQPPRHVQHLRRAVSSSFAVARNARPYPRRPGRTPRSR